MKEREEGREGRKKVRGGREGSWCSMVHLIYLTKDQNI